MSPQDSPIRVRHLGLLFKINKDPPIAYLALKSSELASTEIRPWIDRKNRDVIKNFMAQSNLSLVCSGGSLKAGIYTAICHSNQQVSQS